MLSVRDVWYNTDTLYTDADVVYYMQMDKPIGNDYYDHYTILIDLSQTEETLFSAINATGRNEIRSIEKTTGYTYVMHHSNLQMATVNEFIKAYNDFSVSKKLPLADTARIMAYFENGLLAIAQVLNADKKPVIQHLYRVNSDRVVLISSISTIYLQTDSRLKQEIGAANRFCHWKDMLYFKELGAGLYDWGGWYNGKEDEALLGINKFKEKFGGTITPNYNSIVYISLKGKLFKLLKRLKNSV